MGVVLTHDVTYGTSALAGRIIVSVATLIHRVEYTTMHRLETVTHIG